MPQSGFDCGLGSDGGGARAPAEYLHEIVVSDGTGTAGGGLPDGQRTGPRILA
ncbi:hypothetical protein Shyhy01_18860 [Streptomyces hygroscopicus subsp. hygroscopicus]|nr:hypothetical protein Shyhy01_18860 [Streptomyces hygroscopicus subsp. hygroscopicus]